MIGGGGFHCSKCDGGTAVRDSRPREDGSIRRRRQCVDCGARFTTLEVGIEDTDQVLSGVRGLEPIVVKQAAQAVNILGRLDGQNRALALMLLKRLAGEPISNRVYDVDSLDTAA